MDQIDNKHQALDEECWAAAGRDDDAPDFGSFINELVAVVECSDFRDVIEQKMAVAA